MKAKIYIGAKKYALYIGRKIVEKTLEFLTLPSNFISKKVQELKSLTMWGQSIQDGTPTPDTPIPVESVGDKTKNLFDNAQPNKKINADGSLIGGQTGAYCTDYIPVVENQIYTISCDREATSSSLEAWVVAQYNSNKEFINNSRQTSRSKNVTITIVPNAKYLLVNKLGGDTFNDIQLELGDTATEYVPYGYKVPIEVSGTTTNIYLNEPLRKTGEYADTLTVEGTNVTVTRNVIEEPIDSTKNWIYNTDNKVWRTDTYFDGNTKVQTTPIFCNQYSTGKYGSVTVVDNYTVGTFPSTSVSANMYRLYLKDTEKAPTAISLFREWLQNQNILITYPLATPTTETYTIDTPIELQEGSLTIDVNTNIKPSKIEITGDVDYDN